MAAAAPPSPPDISTDDLRLLQQRINWLVNTMTGDDVLSLRANNASASIGITVKELRALMTAFVGTTPPCLWEHYSGDIGYRSGCGYHYYANTLNADLMAHERTLYKYCPHCGGELIAPDFRTPHDDSTT